MNASSFIPTEALKPFVKNFLIIESGEEELVNRLLPDTSMVLAFRFKGKVNYVHTEEKILLPASVFSGLRRSVRLVNYEAHSGTILVIFTELGASAFFKEPLHELFEESIALNQFISESSLSRFTEQIDSSKNNGSKIKVVENFLLARLSSNKPDALVLSAVQTIHSLKGIGRIKLLADSHCISQDAFEKRFRKATGTTPKYFSSIVRMKNIIHGIQNNLSYTEIALESGFSDQSHFNKEFKRFTGLPPTDFFRNPVFW